MMGDVVAKVSITKILEGMGVQKVLTVDPLKLQEAMDAVRECAALPGVKAIIFKSPCVAITAHRRRGIRFIIQGIHRER